MSTAAASPSLAYVLDPDDPRAPTQEAWDRMTPRERARVLDALPSTLPAARVMPESDVHLDAVLLTRDVLRGYYGRSGRGVYIGNNLVVYYPHEPSFAPDVIAVVDVPTHPRLHWTVTAEGRGLDFVMEILHRGSRAKDLKQNVERYARLGIREYFVFDLRREVIRGYRLPGPEARSYQPILGQAACYRSEVLGLELTVEAGRLRFSQAGAALPETSELLSRVSVALDRAEQRAAKEAARAKKAIAQAKEEAARAEDERARRVLAEQELERRAGLEQELAAALAELARLKGAPR